MSFVAPISTQMEEKSHQSVKILLGLGEASTGTTLLVDSFLILVGV